MVQVRKKYTREEWEAEAIKRFGDDHNDWRFVCPSCGIIVGVQDYKDAGLPSSMIGFSCVGRGNNKPKAVEMCEKNKGDGCNYAGGGLIGLNPITVVFIDGHVNSFFDFAPAKEVGR